MMFKKLALTACKSQVNYHFGDRVVLVGWSCGKN